MKRLQKQSLLLILIFIGCHFYAASQVVITGSHAAFLREGDKSFITATLTNKSNKPVTGQVHLALINPSSNSPVDGWFQNVFPSQFYSIDAGSVIRIQFPIQAAFGYIHMLRYQLEATVLENKKEVVATSTYKDSFQIYTNRILVSDSIIITSFKDTLIKGNFASLLKAPESSTHNSLRISFAASTPLDYWKLQMGNKQFTTAGRDRFDTLLLSDFISNDMGAYTLQTIHATRNNKQQTKIVWTHYNKIEKPVIYNASFRLQKTIQQKIKGRWIDLPENATLHIGDTLNVTLTINTPQAFKKLSIEENTMGSAVSIFSQNTGEKKYATYFTKEISYNSLAKQVFSYQYILTSAGVFNTGNTFVNIETKALKQNAARKTIQLFLPTTEIRIEE
ncbi:MAG: hypothetical protein KA311_01050 [Sediminibacterium sp.]|nr:hypothetical protein [Sediminibacterium sp.]